MRKRLFDILVKTIMNRPGTVLLLCILFTVIMLVGASRVRMKTDIVNMLPKGYPQVEELKTITDNFGSASAETITIESESGDTELMKKCAEDIVKRAKNMYIIRPQPGQKLTFKQKKKLKKGIYPIEGIKLDRIPLAQRIEYKTDTDFFNNHGFIIQQDNDLKNALVMYSSMNLKGLLENINDNFEQEYVEDEANLSTFDGEQRALYGLEALESLIDGVKYYLDNEDSLTAKQSAVNFISGPEYMLSPDKTLMLVRIICTGEIARDAEDAAELASHLVPMIDSVQTLYPELIIGGMGDALFYWDIMESSKKDFGLSSVISLILILILLIGSFGTWKNPFYAVITLIAAVIWTTGFIGFTLQYLNIMSAMFGIILIGLGIDFGIHFISGFTDGRNQGLSIKDSLMFMYEKFGNGVITGGLTTSFAFFSLSFSGFRALIEMGVACGAGIIFCMLAMSIMLPALFAWRAKKNTFMPITIPKFFSFSFLERIGNFVQNLPVSIVVIIITIITMYLSLINIKDIGYEYNTMELEAENIRSVKSSRKILEKFEMSPDFVMLIAEDIKDCRSKGKKIKKIADKTGMIARLDAVSEFLPTEIEQEKNIPAIESFKMVLQNSDITDQITAEKKKEICDELDRLHKNIVEIGEISISAQGEKNKILKRCDILTGKKDEDSKILKLSQMIKIDDNGEKTLGEFQKIAFNVIKKHLLERANSTLVSLDNLPETIRERYVNSKDSSLLMTVYPKGLIWDRIYLSKFISHMKKISEGTTAGPMIGFLFFDIMIDKGRIATLYALGAIIILLFIDFRSVKYMFFALIPILVGACWMLGGMNLANIKFNIANFMVIPLIMGIGIDDGVHLLHRYRIEGRSAMPRVIRFTGRAVLLTSLTTMIAFGSMSFGIRRGNASAAQVLVLGVGACLISSIIVLPAVISLYERIFKGNK